MEAVETEQRTQRAMLFGEDAKEPGLVARVIALEKRWLLFAVLGGNILITAANLVVEFWKP